MSSQAANFSNTTSSGGGKKAVHVKWAGKTIALGTFPAAEADEKCARAKALTRAWRSTMRPKPSRDWVMVELERLGVRVVSGRLGRKAGEEEDVEKKTSDMIGHGAPHVPRNNSMSWSSSADLDNLMQRRSSSLGLSMMNDKDINPRNTLSTLGPLGLDANDPTMPPHRPLVGGGAAAAYEAARADHYAQKREEQQRRASSLGLGVGGGNLGGGGMQMGLSVNPNQHYEMLKLHHMNLLNEIQETTLMMNLYQQQQLQQQQQQLQQQANVEGNDQLAMLQQLGGGGGMDTMYGSQRGSMGLGNDPSVSMLKSQQATAGTNVSKSGAASNGIEEASSKENAALQEELMKSQKEQEALERKLKKLKDDIAKQEKEAEELQKQADAANAKGNTKRSAEEKKSEEAETAEPVGKKAKLAAKEEKSGTKKSEEVKSEATGPNDKKTEAKQAEDK